MWLVCLSINMFSQKTSICWVLKIANCNFFCKICFHNVCICYWYFTI
jgi:hypothetical protein